MASTEDKRMAVLKHDASPQGHCFVCSPCLPASFCCASSVSSVNWEQNLGFDLTYTVSTLHQRFTLVRLLERHMTRSSRAFSITLTTLVFDQRSLWLFEACSCKPASEGLPPSLAQHRV